MNQKSLWLFSGVIGGGIAAFLIYLMLGGLYTITGPNGPVDTAYKMNRLTGQVWLVKTYTKQVGELRVLAAREAEVEKTKQISQQDMPSVAMEKSAVQGRRR